MSAGGTDSLLVGFALMRDLLLPAKSLFFTANLAAPIRSTASCCSLRSPNSQSTRLSFVATLCWRAFQRVVDYFGF